MRVDKEQAAPRNRTTFTAPLLGRLLITHQSAKETTYTLLYTSECTPDTTNNITAA
jgi:hypothetical protein